MKSNVRRLIDIPNEWVSIRTLFEDPVLKTQLKNPAIEIEHWRQAKPIRNKDFSSNGVWTDVYLEWERKLYSKLAIILPTISRGVARSGYLKPNKTGNMTTKEPKGKCSRCRNAVVIEQEAEITTASDVVQFFPMAFRKCNCSKEIQMYCLRCVIREYIDTVQNTIGKFHRDDFDASGICDLPCPDCRYGWNISDIVIVRDPYGIAKNSGDQLIWGEVHDNR